MVSKSSSGMAKSAIDTVRNSISRISDMVSSDIDTQPTIRPVLDLSDVRNGANTISGMFSGNRTLAVDTSAVGSISAAMHGYQNRVNVDDVVSGIKALRKDIATMPRNSYNINGVTYDDGSNIAEAMRVIVQEARIGRRS